MFYVFAVFFLAPTNLTPLNLDFDSSTRNVTYKQHFRAAMSVLTLTYAKTSDAGTDLTIIRMCLLECMPFVSLNAVDRLHDVGTGAGCECCKLQPSHPPYWLTLTRINSFALPSFP